MDSLQTSHKPTFNQTQESGISQTSISQKDAPDRTDSSQLIKAGFVFRVAAYIIDIFLIGIPWVIVVLIGVNTGKSQYYEYLLYLIYATILTGLYGTTIGKRFFKMRVITEDGYKPKFGTAILRDLLGKIISSAILSLGFFWVIWDKDKQGWHDKIAKTYVVFTEPVGKGRKILAYVLALALPILAVLGILAAIVLIAINPKGQMEKARQAAEDMRQQEIMRQNEINSVLTPSIQPTGR